MTATTHSTGDEPRENPGEDTPLGAHEITPEQDAGAVFVGVASHLCTNCGAALATDQKYCVECGTRRGIPRFRVAGPAVATPAPAASPIAPPPAAAISSRLLALLALIVVLVAIGVGFLIGNSSSSTTVHITGGAVATGSTGASSGGSSKASKSGTSKTSSSSSGSGCTAGSPGCKNGKQTGNFFSG